MSQVAENTVYTFALLLAVYLVGTTAGAAAYPRLRRRAADEGALQDSLLLALAAACLVGTLLMSGAGAAKSWLLSSLPASVPTALAAEAALAAAAFLPPTFLMGALFAHLCTRARDIDLGFSRALGFNTLGAALAPAAFGVLVVPRLGTKLGLLLIALGYIATRSRRTWASSGIAVVAVVALVAWLPPLAFVEVPDGGRLVSYDEGVLATVTIVEDARGVARLHINNRQQEGSSATLYADGRQGLLPLLLHGEPQRALFLGLGTGATAAAAAAEPRLAVDVVELLPEVVAASTYFMENTVGVAARERLRIVTADARRFVRATPERYDVVVSDNFHPARSGSAALYTVEHFAAVRERLAPGGLFCQWLPLHQLDLATLRSIVRSFLAVYPHATAMLATYSLETPVLGLVAHGGDTGDGRVDIDDLRARLATVQREGRSLESFGIGDELALLGTFVAGPHALAEFAGDAPLNTDDRPIVAYRAPRAAYAPDSVPADRLLELMAVLALAPGEIVAEPRDATFEHRLAAYWQARNGFLAAGRDVHATSDVRLMMAQVRESLLAALRISPEFRPAYDPLLAMALDLARTDAAAARELLADLQDVAAGSPGSARRAGRPRRGRALASGSALLRGDRLEQRRSLFFHFRVRVVQQSFQRRAHLGERRGLALRIRAKGVAGQRRLLELPKVALRLAVIVAVFVVDLDR